MNESSKINQVKWIMLIKQMKELITDRHIKNEFCFAV